VIIDNLIFDWFGNAYMWYQQDGLYGWSSAVLGVAMDVINDTKIAYLSGVAAVADIEGQEQNVSNARLDRIGRVLLPFWTNAKARKHLKYIAVEEERTQQKLLSEALNMLFQSRGKPPIA
jgi:hypothetical protein